MTTETTTEAPPKAGVTLVTSENFEAYVDSQMPAKKSEKTEEPKADSPEAKAKVELEKVEKEKAERKAKEEGEEIDHPDKDKKGRLNERFSEITKARKEAEAKAEKAAADAKAARDARDKAEADAKALRDKYEPPKSDELGPEPQPSQFTDVTEYSKALKDWTADKTRKEDAATQAEAARKSELEAVAKSWNERLTKYKADNPEFEKRLSESDVKVSDQVRDAILESEVGPAILDHFSQNPGTAEAIGKLSVQKALREIGKLEVSLAPAKKEEKQPDPKTPIAEISKAPAPITPLKGASQPVVRLSGNDEVPSSMSYEDWKALRQAGKIK